MNRTEAIKIIKTATVYTPEEMEALETLIPELKESRDEQIRKAIIKSLDMMPFPEDNLPGTDVTYKEAVAWLEKQKECLADNNKTSVSEDEKIRKWLVNYFAKIGENWIHREFTCEQIIAYLEKQNHDGKKWITPAELNRLLTLRYESGFNDGVRGEMKKQEDHFRDDTKMVEQKPADEQFPPLGGLGAIKAKFYDMGFKNGFDEGVDSVKPAEWSEEDDYNIVWLIETLLGLDGDKEFTSKCKEVTRWLKSLREQLKRL